MLNLFLASYAIHPESMEKLKKHVGGSFAGKSIAFVPTASNGISYDGWKTRSTIGVVNGLGAKVDIIPLEETCTHDVIADIRGHDIVWFTGGMSGYLLYWIRRTKLDQALPQMMDKGMLYVGSSAGSIICGTSQEHAEWYIGDPEPGASLLPGLGWLDFEIYPHYEEKLRPEIEKLWKKGKLYLLQDGEAMTVRNGKTTVLGETRIIQK